MHWLRRAAAKCRSSSERGALPYPPSGYEVSLTLPIPGPIDSRLRLLKVGVLVPATFSLYCLVLSLVRPGYWKRPTARSAANWLLSMLVTRYVSDYLVTPPHEALHGLALWAYTGEQPVMSLRVQDGWAYAAAPNWWFPRNQYLVVLLLPVSVLTLLMLLLLPVIPTPLLPALGWMVTRSVADSSADLYVSWQLLKRPSSYLHDTTKVFTFWKPSDSM